MREQKTITPEPDHEAIAARLERLLSSDALTIEQSEILSDLMLELSNSTGITVWHPGLVRRFYLIAAEYQGEMGIRDELLETLDRIEAGDKFTGYESEDFLERYELRLEAYRLAEDKGVNRKVRRELRQAAESGPMGTPDFKELIARAEASRKKGGAE
jgi:hypothetical protein